MRYRAILRECGPTWRNFIAFITGALLYFGLGVAGTQLVAFLILRNIAGLTDRQVLLRLTPGELLVVGPSVAVVVGVSVAALVQRRFWWLAGVALLPMLVYGLVNEIHAVDALTLIIFAGQVALACVSAFVTSRFKKPCLV